MKAIVSSIISGANTVLEQVVQAKLGLPTAETDPILNAAESKLAELIDSLSSHPSQQLDNSPPRPAPTPGVAAKVASVLAFGLLTLGLLTGCLGSPSTGHVVRVVATGTKLGVTQNPDTGIYELGIQRVQTEITTVPVFFTNGEYRIAPVVMRYEVNTHSAVFGNAALTSTMATGSNAVLTAIGGAYPPINAGTGTSNELQTALPK